MIFYILVLLLCSANLNVNSISNKEFLIDHERNEAFANYSTALKSEVKVFCIILTTPKYKYSRVVPQINTWVKRCNNFAYASAVADKSIRAIKSFWSDNYSYSFGKIRGAIQQLYKIHGDNYDWYMKTDDDTYVVMDNLRTYLLTKNASEEHYLGFKLDFIRKGKRHIYHQGGAGMVFSRAAIKKLVSKGFTSKHKCSQNPQNLDDRIIGRCMENLNINVTDARDYKNRLTFCPASVVDFSTPHKNEQYNKFITKNPTGFGKGMPALSPYPISFHYVPGEMQYALEYLFYKGKVIGQDQTLFNSIECDNCTDNLIAKATYFAKMFYKS